MISDFASEGGGGGGECTFENLAENMYTFSLIWLKIFSPNHGLVCSITFLVIALRSREMVSILCWDVTQC